MWGDMVQRNASPAWLSPTPGLPKAIPWTVTPLAILSLLYLHFRTRTLRLGMERIIQVSRRAVVGTAPWSLSTCVPAPSSLGDSSAPPSLPLVAGHPGGCS